MRLHLVLGVGSYASTTDLMWEGVALWRSICSWREFLRFSFRYYEYNYTQVEVWVRFKSILTGVSSFQADKIIAIC